MPPRGDRMLAEASYRVDGRLVPASAQGLRAGAVTLRVGEVMDWHSTRAREELLVGLRGSPTVQVRRWSGRSAARQLDAGWCLFLGVHTWHRVVNRSRTTARYLYITGPIDRASEIGERSERREHRGHR